jgi:hypothetical protein
MSNLSGTAVIPRTRTMFDLQVDLRHTRNHVSDIGISFPLAETANQGVVLSEKVQ